MSTALALEPPAPLQRGQHQNHALAAWRRARAIEMRVEGKRYQDIAEALGYANRGTVSRIVNQALQKREHDDVEFYRHVEHDRLNRLQLALWGKAMAGDVPSVKAILKILDARCKLLGLYEEPPPKERPWPCCQGPATVVIRGDDCRWEGCETHGKFGSDDARRMNDGIV